MKNKNRKTIFRISTIITIILLLLISPIIFNFDKIFHIGYYPVNDQKAYHNEDGSVKINIETLFEIVYISHYSLDINIKASSEGLMTNMGMTKVNYTVFINSDEYRWRDVNYDPPTKSFHRDFMVNYIYQKDVVQIKGFINIQYQSNEILNNETYTFTLIYAHPINEDYHTVRALIWMLTLVYFSSFVLIPLRLKRVIKPQLTDILDEETVERDKKFFKFIKKREES